ncbi:MAG: c-type cytochrome [Capsulimonadaceae bacterium]|nr:c-type cytochrome [Capsulimonadaceae bacterium]
MRYSWTEFHGALTHFPVALIIAAFLFEAGALLFSKVEWRTVSFWCLAAGVIGAAISLLSGTMAANETFGAGASPPHALFWHRTGAIVTASLGALLLLGRIAAKDKLSGPGRAASMAALVAVTAAVSFTGYLGGSMVFGSDQPDAVAAFAAPAQPIADPAADQGLSKAALQGARLVQEEHCLSCHRINGQGASDDPDLTHEGSRHSDPNWQVRHLQHPSQVDAGSDMPSFAALSKDQLNALAAYLVSRK